MTSSRLCLRTASAVVASAALISGTTCPVSSAAPRVPSRALDVGGQIGAPGGGASTLGGGAGALGGPAGALGGGAAASLGGTVTSLGAGIEGGTSSAITGAMLTAIGTSVLSSASFVLRETEDVLNETTTPQLRTSWFSAAYWKVAGIATLLTLPFLFAASVQALLRSDLTLLLRAAFGYLPLALLSVAIAAPVTMLLLSASDELAAVVASASGGHGTSFFSQAVSSLGATGLVSGSPFIGLVIGLFIVAGALLLWVELLMREAAVYVVVLMLPLAFAALVWPARRIWAIRSIELLVALILSKFAIVAVLSLGAAALSHSSFGSLGAALSGLVLVILGAFTPWALLRLIPLSELASSTAGTLRGHTGTALAALQRADVRATDAAPWRDTPGQMRRMADNPEAARSAAQTPAPPPDANGARETQSAEAGDRGAA